MRKDVVNQVFLEEAARAGAEGRAPTTKHIPDVTSRGGPLWHHGGNANHAGHEREVEDEQGSEDEEEEEEKRTRMPTTRLERRRSLNAVAWTTKEEESIEACKGARAKTREQNRLLHNRHAAEKGQHVLAASSGDRMRCAACGQQAAWRRILQWPKTKCTAKVEK